MAAPLLVAAWLLARSAVASPIDEFRESWRARGRTRAEVAWMRGRRVLVLSDKEAAYAVPTVESALRDQLLSLGAEGFSVGRAEAPERADPATCVKALVMDQKCFFARVEGLRAVEPTSSAVLVYVTGAAIGKLPRRISATQSEGPPAGITSAEQGVLLLSEYYPLHQRSVTPKRRLAGMTFTEHGLDNTTRHELGHLLGLAHHDQMKNPGFAEPTRCPTCAHPDGQCMMTCGSGDDDWRALERTGKRLGLCAKCDAAARSFFEGFNAALAGR